MKDDSIEGIYDTLKTCAVISKSAGGIGLHVHNIRASGAYIAGTFTRQAMWAALVSCCLFNSALPPATASHFGCV